jgi:Fe-S cluster biogenesis protein NfuA
MCDQCGGCGSSAGQSVQEQVKKVVEEIRPALQDHGGDIELVGVDPDNTVRVKLQGACSGCPGAAMTMKMGVERILKQKVPQVKAVKAV